MKIYKMLLAVSVISFVVSGIFTLIWFTSDAYTLLAFILTLGMAIVYETFKIGSGIMAYVCKWIPLPLRIILGVISITLFGYSVLSSTGYLVNNSNTAQNVNINSSQEYKQMLEARDIQKQTFEAKKQEIENLKQSKQKVISGIENQKNSLPKDYITAKQNLSNTQLAKESEYSNSISQKTQELQKISSVLQSPIDTSKLKMYHENGSIAVSEYIADFLNNHSFKTPTTPYTAKGVDMFLKIFASLIFEIIAWVSALLVPIAKQHEFGTTPPKIKKPLPFADSQFEDNSSQNIREIKSGRLKGMKFKNKPVAFAKTPFDEFKIQKYWNAIKENTKNGKAPSHQWLIGNLELTKKECDTARKILKERNKIEAKTRHTKVV